MELIGFRLRFFPHRFPFYCLKCATDAANEKEWWLKRGDSRKAGVPIIRTDDGLLVRHVKIGGSLTKRDWYIEDEEVIADAALHIDITELMVSLGLRLAPSMPQEVSENVRCERCKTPLSQFGLRQSLNGFLSNHGLVLAGATSSGVRLGQLANLKAWLFETGAILGRARSGQLPTLAVMMSRPGMESNVAALLERRGKELMDECGEHEPQTFFKLHRKVGNLEPERLLKEGMKTMPLREAYMVGSVAVVDGVAFGASYPALTERLYLKQYEEVDEESWHQAREYGLDIREEPSRMPLQEREHEALLELGMFVSEYYPELLEPLRLRLTTH